MPQEAPLRHGLLNLTNPSFLSLFFCGIVRGKGLSLGHQMVVHDFFGRGGILVVKSGHNQAVFFQGSLEPAWQIELTAPHKLKGQAALFITNKYELSSASASFLSREFFSLPCDLAFALQTRRR
jgi:hypothetical protein